MSLVASKCPRCGADVSIDDSRDFSFCSYCGFKITVEKIKLDTAAVSADKIISADTLFDRAYIFLSDRDFGRAEEYFDKVLDITPRSSKAYWGLLMSKIKVSSQNEMEAKLIKIDGFVEFKNAVRFADEKEKAIYEGISKKINLAIQQKMEYEAFKREEKAFDDAENNINNYGKIVKVLQLTKIFLILGVSLLTLAFLMCIALAVLDFCSWLFSVLIFLLLIMLVAVMIGVSIAESVYIKKINKIAEKYS